MPAIHAADGAASPRARTPALPAWLWLFLLLVLAATLSPLWFHCAPQPLGVHFDLRDVALNTLLLMPLGMALRGWRWPWLALAAVALSGCVEGLQRWLPRDPNVFDFGANVAGALLGRALPPLPALRPPRGWLVAGLGALALLTLAAALEARAGRRGGGFSNWKDYPLLIGNEANGGRPWSGRLRRVSIYDRALDPQSAPDPGRAWRDGGPVLHLDLGAPPRGRLDGPEGPRPLVLDPPRAEGFEPGPGGLVVRGGRWRLPDAAARHLQARLVATERLSIHARLRADDFQVVGPARIVSLSQDELRRNFTLGQHRRELQLRVRTPGNGRNGDRETALTFGGPLADEMQDVWAVFDGEEARIFVDGACRGDGLLALARTRRITGPMIASTLCVATASAALAAAALVGGGMPRRRGLAFAAGGAAAWGLLAFAGCWDHLPHLRALAPALGVASLLAAAPLLGRGPGSLPA